MPRKSNKQKIINIRDNTVVTLAIDRSPKSLRTWNTAIRSAENIVNPTRKILYDLYEDIMLDTHLSSVWSKRVLAIANTDIVFTDEAGNEHEGVKELMDTEWFGQMLEHIINSRAYGHSLIDLQTPDLTDVDSLMYQECEIVDRRYVKPEFGLRVLQPSDTTGYAYREEPFKHVVLEAGRKKDLGLLLKVAPWVLLKRGDIEDWSLFNEMFGMPLRKGKYNPNMPGEKETLTQAMEETAGKAYVIVPDGSEVEYVESKSSGNNENYERFARFCDEQMSKHIVGQTLTTESTDKGSHALGNIHEGIEEKIARSDRKFVQRILNSKFKAALIYAGYTDIEPYKFDFREDEETLSTTEQLTNDINIHTKVGKLKREYFVEKYNVEFDEAAIAQEQARVVPPDNSQPNDKSKGKPSKKLMNMSEHEDDKGWVRTILGYMKRFFGKAPNPKNP